MTNTEIKKSELIYTPKELEVEVLNTINFIQEIIDERNYHLSVDSKLGLEKLKTVKWTEYIGRLSKNQIKKLNRSIFRVHAKRSRYDMNMFFRLLHTRVLSEKSQVKGYWDFYPQGVTPDNFKKVNVQIPMKEQNIQKARKVWKEAQVIADEKLSSYKEIKGDYYKLRGF